MKIEKKLIPIGWGVNLKKKKEGKYGENFRPFSPS